MPQTSPHSIFLSSIQLTHSSKRNLLPGTGHHHPFHILSSLWGVQVIFLKKSCCPRSLALLILSWWEIVLCLTSTAEAIWKVIPFFYLLLENPENGSARSVKYSKIARYPRTIDFIGSSTGNNYLFLFIYLIIYMWDTYIIFQHSLLRKLPNEMHINIVQ